MTKEVTTASLKQCLATPAGKRLMARHSLRRTFSPVRKSAEKQPQHPVEIHATGTLFKPLGELAVAGGNLVVHHAYSRRPDERKLRLFSNELARLLSLDVQHKRPKG
ncbi:hypothetical protein HY571_02765 [Candidatus Micrarchaeota archaeon]|nr:hypothetical protein [Candidatus Micrarchaeota archaeon]